MKRFATVLVGHRGVGKSSLLHQLGSPFAELQDGPAQFLDLDQEIQSRTGHKVSDLFNQGEPEFREIENNILKELVDKANAAGILTVIAAGAGIEEMPETARVVWLRRSTDSAGRVFLDRPRLNAKVKPIDEYLERFSIRDGRYRSWMDEELWVPEGYESGIEEFFGSRQDWLLPYELTLLPSNFKSWPEFWSKRRNWGVRHFEIRDDLLTPGEMATALKSIPAEHVLYAHRKSNFDYKKIVDKHKVMLDWPLEMGPAPASAEIVSRHERLGALEEAMKDLAAAQRSAPMLAKLAVQIKDFNELEAGHRWWLEDPENRVFLPRSLNGRWQWYRALFCRKMPLHFFREGDGSSLDQPYLWQTLHQPVADKRFAAVLGSPINHSRSPVEHHSFFREFGVPIVAIELSEDEFDGAIPVLSRMGLTFAAVTSPLKNKASALVGAKGPVNTLWQSRGRLYGANTDAQALLALADELRVYKNVWLWGAGAMRVNVEVAFPRVQVISAREGVAGKVILPDLMIWATGRGREFSWPPPGIKPKMVLDMNYSEDSPGLEFAVLNNLTYQSGLRLFKLQAELQRQHWRKALES